MKLLSYLPLLLLLAFIIITGKASASYVFDQNSIADLNYIQTVGTSSKLKVFWWNVAWGKFNGFRYLDYNVVAMANSTYAPDVMAFGEYKAGIFEPYTEGILKKNYPYSTFVNYSSGSPVGILVYSKYPITTYKGGQIDWSPAGRSASSKAAYKSHWRGSTSHAAHWDRPFFFVRLHKNGREYNVAPLHLLSPYAGMVSVDGYWETSKQATIGNRNPLGHQINYLKAHLRANFGKQYISRRFVLIGDFNTPDKFFGVQPRMFKDLWKGMRRVKLSGAKSFPSIAGGKDLGKAGSLVKGTIDHAFVSPLIRNRHGRVLSFAGSDHYPLYIVAE